MYSICESGYSTLTYTRRVRARTVGLHCLFIIVSPRKILVLKAALLIKNPSKLFFYVIMLTLVPMPSIPPPPHTIPTLSRPNLHTTRLTGGSTRRIRGLSSQGIVWVAYLLLARGPRVGTLQSDHLTPPLISHAPVFHTCLEPRHRLPRLTY